MANIICIFMITGFINYKMEEIKKRGKFMRKQTIMLAAFLFFTAQTTNANTTVYSTQKLNDGTTIKMCRFNNGKIDYCTMDDAMKALDILHNPRKYLSEKEKIQYDKNAAYIKIAKTEFPILDKILNLETEYKSKLKNLQYKQDLGVTINSKDISLLEYKINILYSLIHGTIFDEKQYITGTLDFANQYADLLKAKDNKDITQEEFEDAKSKLKTENDKLENYYNKLTAMTYTSGKTTDEWLIDNYPGNKSSKVFNQIFNQIAPETNTRINPLNLFF